MDSQTLERIEQLARRPLLRSIRDLRARWSPAFPARVRTNVRVVPSDPERDVVNVGLAGEAVFGEVALGDGWLEGAERCGVLVVDGHFLLGYRSFDEEGRPVQVDALRILPTDGVPATYIPSGPEYAISPATIDWSGDVPALVWDEDDLLQAAVVWMRRWPAEVLRSDVFTLHPEVAHLYPEKTYSAEEGSGYLPTWLFTLAFDGLDGGSDSVQQALWEAGCDDALFREVDGGWVGEFARQRRGFDEAVSSAETAVEEVGGRHELTPS
jgi:hypothetical protein